MCAPRHSAPTHGVQVREQLCRRALLARADDLVMALMQPIICCVRAQSALEFVTEFSGGATPHREAVWLRARALSSRPKLIPASPIVRDSRLMMPVHVGGRLADSG